MRRSLAYAATPFVALATSLALAGPASAHFCTNPDKNAHAPMAGVNYMLTGFNQDGPVLVHIEGRPEAIGGFVLIPAGTFGPQQTTDQYTHTGNHVGPGEDHETACDGHGIDYLFCGWAPPPAE